MPKITIGITRNEVVLVRTKPILPCSQISIFTTPVKPGRTPPFLSSQYEEASSIWRRDWCKKDQQEYLTPYWHVGTGMTPALHRGPMVWFRNHFRRANSSRAAYLPMVHDGLHSKN